MSKTTCKNTECGKAFKSKNKACPHCGTGNPMAKAEPAGAAAGGDGGTVAADDKKPVAKAACGGCGHQQKVTRSFCGECGTPMAKAAEVKYQEALGELGQFAKSQAALGTTLDPAKPGAGDVGAEILAKATSGVEVDANELIATFAEGHNVILRHQVAQGGELRTIQHGLGLMAKAMEGALRQLPLMVKAAVEARIGTMETKLDAVLGGSNGRRPLIAGEHPVRLLNKAVPGADGAGDKDETLKGRQFTKAALALELAGKIPAGSATIVQTYAEQMGMSLGMMCKAEDPEVRRLGESIQQEQAVATAKRVA